MPAVQAPTKVLVSGANSYIAMWVVQNLLDQGYTVRGTVRSAEKGEHLKKLFSKFGKKLEIIVVEDIAKASLAITWCSGSITLPHGYRKELSTRL